jgi:hypothetical protein
VAEIQFGNESLGNFRAKLKACICTAFGSNRHLQSLLNEFPKKTKEADKIAFAGTVGANQHTQGAKLEIFQLADGFETFNR